MQFKLKQRKSPTRHELPQPIVSGNSNLQEPKFKGKRDVASPHLKSMHSKQKGGPRNRKESSRTPSSHNRPEKRGDKAQTEPSKMGKTRGKGLGPTLQQNPELGF